MKKKIILITILLLMLSLPLLGCVSKSDRAILDKAIEVSNTIGEPAIFGTSTGKPINFGKSKVSATEYDIYTGDLIFSVYRGNFFSKLVLYYVEWQPDHKLYSPMRYKLTQNDLDNPENLMWIWQP